jgi:hypothetical protein
MVNAGSAAELADVLASITMFLSAPTSAATGVPESKPLLLLKVAQAGLFWMLKLTVWPLAALTVGTNEYCRPT